MTAQGPECLFVHFDKSFYVSGETIWFKVYQLDHSNEVNSRVLHVDIVSHQNELISQQRLKIENGSSFGTVTLPVASEEGYYRFRAYTRYNLNFDPPIIFEANIPIYSLDKQDSQNTQYPTRSDTPPSGAAGISVVTRKAVYQPRDSISISFEVNGNDSIGGQGSYSISIVQSDLVIPKFDFYQQLKCPDLSPKKGRLLPPERSLLVKGRLQHPETKQRAKARLVSLYMDKTAQLIRTSSRDGQLIAAVPDFWDTEIFQILNHDPYNPSVLQLVPEQEDVTTSPYYNDKLPRRTRRVVNYINQFRKRRKIIELFDLYHPSPPRNEPTKTMVPDAVYKTSDYKQIYTFEAFINEAINNVRVRTIDGVQSVRLFNREMGDLFVDHSWYLVDGFLTYNEKAVLEIPYSDILEVRLYSKTSTLETFFQGFMLRSGVMEIITRDVKYVRELMNSPNVVEIEGFALPQDFTNGLHLSDKMTQPDLRGTLYWAPNVLTDANGKGQITIPLSDDTGKFSIVIMGTNNDHQAVTGYHTFEIKMD